ncbi:MAG: stage II sporulation protein D [Firmicutes bacterium HGW-Firmicutes-1]|jgi:stage II sporulation protein D|nr:MAG: stage II sporulation protein D [Firmicutes bacterium HGW-Firmicutes-1]
MKEKIISKGLIILAVFFIPIFITTTLTDFRKSPIHNQDTMVTIHYSDGEVQIPLESYLIGVVAAEMPVFFEDEALKAQAVTARTYTMKRYNKDPNIVFTKDIQNYYSDKELEEVWGVNDYAFYYSKIRDAVEETNGQVIIYQDELIDAVFHSTSIGRTRSAMELWGQDIPYLQGAESLEDINAPTYLHQYTFAFKEFQDKILQFDSKIVFSKELPSEIQIIERNKEGYILSVQVGNKIYTGEEFRKIFDIASSNFTISFVEDSVNLVCKGYGHGVGMSQYGAEAFANMGKGYQEILQHYYKDVTIIALHEIKEQ